MISIDKITEIFCDVDDFCPEYQQIITKYTLRVTNKKKIPNRKSKLSQSEVICILILFHLWGSRNLKYFYLHYVQKHLQEEFPQIVSCNRFVELQKQVAIPLGIFLKTQCLGKSMGISFVDSTLLRSCHIKWEKQHKNFKNIAQKGKCSFFLGGGKLHLIINRQRRSAWFYASSGQCRWQRVSQI